MENDQLFRVILACGLAVVLPVGVYHRVRSMASGERLDRRREGLFILLTLRPIALAGMIGLLTFVVNPSRMSWSALPLSLWLRWIGVGIGVAASLLLIWTYRCLGTNLTDTVVVRKCHTLVTRGSYRFVRHPFYVGAAMAIVANALVTANWFIGITGGIVIVLLILRTTTEEEQLTKHFGIEYVTYMSRTGRFVPRILHTSSLVKRSGAKRFDQNYSHGAESSDSIE